MTNFLIKNSSARQLQLKPITEWCEVLPSFCVPKTSHYLRWIIIKCQPNVTYSTRLVIEGKKRVIIAKPLSAEQQKPFFVCAQNWFAAFDANDPSDSSLNYCLPSHHFAMNSCFLNAFRKRERLITEFVVMTIKTAQRRTVSTAVVNFNSFSPSGHFGFIYRAMKFPLDACVKGEWKLNCRQMKFGHFRAHRPVHAACHYRAAQIVELFRVKLKSENFLRSR